MYEQHRTFILTPNHTRSFPSTIIYLDCETRYIEGKREQTHTLRLGVAINQRYVKGYPKGKADTFVFYTAKQFWDWVERFCYPKRTIWLVAHNFGFDIGAIDGFKELVKRGWTARFWAFAPQLFLLSVYRRSSKLQLVDSLGYMRRSLQAIGEKVGLEKLTMPSPDDTTDKWLTYCTRDVEVLKQAFESFMEFVSEHNLGRFSFTGPGQALAAYRHRFMSERLILHRVPALLDTEKASYHGGRTEAFYIGTVPQSPIYYLDVISMYGSVMKDEYYPCELLGRVSNPTRSEVKQALQRVEVLATCEVDLPEPALPYIGERLTFPIGRFKTVLAGPEFRYCYERGYVKNVSQIICYRRGQPFREYVDYFWELKKRAKEEGNQTMEWLSKLFQNAFYGKWGQRNPTYEVRKANHGEPIGMQTVISSVDGRRESRLCMGGKIWIKTGEKLTSHTSYPLASWITSAARVKLWELATVAGREHVYYCDTDSLFVDETGYNRLLPYIQPGVLGKLEVKQVVNKLTIRGAKDYEVDGVLRIKGVSKKSIQVDSNTFEYVSFEGVRTRLRKDHVGQVVQTTVSKVLGRDYQKGIVTPYGHVNPFVLSPETPLPAYRKPPKRNKRGVYIDTPEDQLYDAMRIQKVYIIEGMDLYTEWCEGVPSTMKRLLVSRNPAKMSLDEWGAQYGITVSTLIEWLNNARYVKDREETMESLL